MICLTAEEIANLVVKFWEPNSIFDSFLTCKNPEEVLFLANAFEVVYEKEGYTDFFEALRKFVINFFQTKSNPFDSLVLDFDCAPNNTFRWLASMYEVEIPQLPINHTLILQTISSDKSTVVSVLAKKKQKAEEPWLIQHYMLIDYSEDQKLEKLLKVEIPKGF